MANKIQLKRGLKSRLTTLSSGEPAYTTDTRELFVGTGSGNVNMGGSMWYVGTDLNGTSSSITFCYGDCPQVKLGDIYLNISNGNVYQCITAGSKSSAQWKYKGNIKGPQGDNVPNTYAQYLPILKVVDSGESGMLSCASTVMGENFTYHGGDMFFIQTTRDIASGCREMYDMEGALALIMDKNQKEMALEPDTMYLAKYRTNFIDEHDREIGDVIIIA